ncbi:MAG: nucleotidyl transferase AbiEii/AbiGii toxin family protein [Candidatus Riflebacteria bacterium]|nr:nucleotidyl transferase AbiEii/AbiGii toxin family protein [Candidatus Riflebacteria bacterium]
MKTVARLSEKHRRELFAATAGKMRVVDAVIEKDFWACFVLKEIFADQAMRDTFLFKGGTSLSKCYSLIKRFSEDIDLILDWRQLGITDELAWQDRSATQQDKFNQQIDELSRGFIQASILPPLKNLLPDLELKIDPRDGNVILVRYPALFVHDYFLDYIKLEIGPRASRIPKNEVSISSYAGEQYPDIFEQPWFKVMAITAERTFWEKATILHQVAFADEAKSLLPRYSRHFYDLGQMANSTVRTRALSNLELLRDVAEFKSKFYRSPAARYDLARPGTLKILPSPAKLQELKTDYLKMQEMFFVTPPAFETLIADLKKLENEINSLSVEDADFRR